MYRFEDLRIRREKRKENSRKQVEKSASKDGHSDKVACLLFTATVQTDRGTIKLTAQSNPIQLSKFGDHYLQALITVQ